MKQIELKRRIPSRLTTMRRVSAKVSSMKTLVATKAAEESIVIERERFRDITMTF